MADFDSVYRSKTLHSLPAWNLADIDAVLVLSFGGPEGPEQVLPFLENVTRGRGIPRERLEEVAVHYHHFDGVSPLNQLNREIVANIEAELQNQNFPIPVYFGNRNWHPYANDVAEEISRAGHRKVMVFATSAWGLFRLPSIWGRPSQAKPAFRLCRTSAVGFFKSSTVL